ncbi:MAG TPA: YjbQ family protein [Kofleriaceae bacterium]
MIYRGELTVATRGRGTYDITRDVARIVGASGAKEGLATIWIAHTSASLIVCENADASVRRDLEAFAARLVPDGDKRSPTTPRATTTCRRTCAPC